MLTVVMYHYVRAAEKTAYPGIKARSPSQFEGQLDYIGRHYASATCEDVRAAYAGKQPLPENACLLTFDDALVDHVETVLPALRRRNITGCFCLPARPVLERRVLDVQKTQFILAVSDDHHELVRRLLKALRQFRDMCPIPTDDELRSRYARPGRYDGPDTMLVKRLLQDGLPEAPRSAVLAELFASLVSDDEERFASELYLSLSDARELAKIGMDVAGHGYDHRRLALLDRDAQRDEIERTRDFLALVMGVEPDGWTMCYPYGDRDATTLRLLVDAGCSLGLTTHVALADPATSPLELPRLDTNDLPVARDAPLGEWTRPVAA